MTKNGLGYILGDFFRNLSGRHAWKQEELSGQGTSRSKVGRLLSSNLN
jgi:hypothetical protein